MNAMQPYVINMPPPQIPKPVGYTSGEINNMNERIAQGRARADAARQAAANTKPMGTGPSVTPPPSTGPSVTPPPSTGPAPSAAPAPNPTAAGESRVSKAWNTVKKPFVATADAVKSPGTTAVNMVKGAGEFAGRVLNSPIGRAGTWAAILSPKEMGDPNSAENEAMRMERARQNPEMENALAQYNAGNYEKAAQMANAAPEPAKFNAPLDPKKQLDADTPAPAANAGTPLMTARSYPPGWSRNIDADKTVKYAGPNDSNVSFVARNLGQDLPLENYLAGKRSSSGLDSEAIAMGNKNMAEGRTGGGSFSVVKMPTPEEVERRGDLEYYRKWMGMDANSRGPMDPQVAARLGKPELGPGPQVRIIGESGGSPEETISNNTKRLYELSRQPWSEKNALEMNALRHNIQTVSGADAAMRKGEVTGPDASDLVDAEELALKRREFQWKQDNEAMTNLRKMAENDNERLGTVPAESALYAAQSIAKALNIPVEDAYERMMITFSKSEKGNASVGDYMKWAVNDTIQSYGAAE